MLLSLHAFKLNVRLKVLFSINPSYKPKPKPSRIGVLVYCMVLLFLFFKRKYYDEYFIFKGKPGLVLFLIAETTSWKVGLFGFTVSMCFVLNKFTMMISLI